MRTIILVTLLVLVLATCDGAASSATTTEVPDAEAKSGVEEKSGEEEPAGPGGAVAEDKGEEQDPWQWTDLQLDALNPCQLLQELIKCNADLDARGDRSSRKWRKNFRKFLNWKRGGKWWKNKNQGERKSGQPDENEG